MRIETSAFEVAQRFIGVREVPGKQDNPLVLAMLKLDGDWPDHDEVPWCSAFLNFVCWLLRLPRSKSLRARSWLQVGRSVPLDDARVGFDVVILQRGAGEQPGPEVINAPGHVGLFAGTTDSDILLLGGNQGDRVSVSHYPRTRLLGVRRLVA